MAPAASSIPHLQPQTVQIASLTRPAHTEAFNGDDNEYVVIRSQPIPASHHTPLIRHPTPNHTQIHHAVRPLLRRHGGGGVPVEPRDQVV